MSDEIVQIQTVIRNIVGDDLLNQLKSLDVKFRIRDDKFLIHCWHMGSNKSVTCPRSQNDHFSYDYQHAYYREYDFKLADPNCVANVRDTCNAIISAHKDDG